MNYKNIGKLIAGVAIVLTKTALASLAIEAVYCEVAKPFMHGELVVIGILSHIVFGIAFGLSQYNANNAFRRMAKRRRRAQKRERRRHSPEAQALIDAKFRADMRNAMNLPVASAKRYDLPL